MPETDSVWPLRLSLVWFGVAVALVGIFGVRMTRLAGRLAAQTGLGEAMMGALFLGAATSLAEIVTCTTAAVNNHPDLAISNAVGSIAGQTAFLAVADMFYRRANLEHAAASAGNLMLAAMLMTLLAIPLLTLGFPDFSVWGIHPISLAILVMYIGGMWLLSRTRDQPMWQPRSTRETVPPDRSQQDHFEAERSLPGLWLDFAMAAAFVALAGWLLAHSAVGITAHTGISETIAGGLLTGLTSSLPELVTAVTAVRMGALTLAVGDVLGGNAFDTLLIAVSDVAYRPGSIYAAISSEQFFLIALAIVLTGILLIGLLHRQKHGIGNIGLESLLVLLIYVGAFALLAGTG